MSRIFIGSISSILFLFLFSFFPSIIASMTCNLAIQSKNLNLCVKIKFAPLTFNQPDWPIDEHFLENYFQFFNLIQFLFPNQFVLPPPKGQALVDKKLSFGLNHRKNHWNWWKIGQWAFELGKGNSDLIWREKLNWINLNDKDQAIQMALAHFGKSKLASADWAA